MRGIRLADFFQRQHVRQGIHSSPAVLLRHFDAHKAHLAHFFDGGVWELARLVELGRNGDDLILGKITRRLADHFVLISKGEQTVAYHSLLLFKLR